MSPDDRSDELTPGRPDEHLPGERPGEQADVLSPAQLRRFQLWRAMTDLSKAQADGRLSPEQTRLLEALADNLQRLAAQLTQLAELGQQCSELLAAEQPASVPEGRLLTDPAAD